MPLNHWSESCGSKFTAQEGFTIVQEDSCFHWSKKANSAFREEIENGGILLMTKCRDSRGKFSQDGSRKESLGTSVSSHDGVTGTRITFLP